MPKQFKTVLYTLSAVVLAVGFFFLHIILPYLIVAGLVIWILVEKPWKWF